MGSILFACFPTEAAGLLLCQGAGAGSAASFLFVCRACPSAVNVYALPSSVSAWTQQFVVLRVKVDGKRR